MTDLPIAGGFGCGFRKGFRNLADVDLSQAPTMAEGVDELVFRYGK